MGTIDKNKEHSEVITVDSGDDEIVHVVFGHRKRAKTANDDSDGSDD